MAGWCRGEGWRVALLACGLACDGLGCGGDDGEPQAWAPTDGLGSSGASTDAAGSADAASDGPTAGAACEPGDVTPCLCPDGLSLGEQHCAEGSLGACECEGDTSGSTGDPMPPLPAEVCYLGEDRSGTTCLPLTAFYADMPAGYAYPPGVRDDGQDRPPLGLVDIQDASPTLLIAPNFALDELARLEVGRWAVLQPHAVVSLQNMRDAAGSIGVLTGYLSPTANAAAGLELYERHQYGDGFDLEPHAVTVSALADLCAQEGGAAVQFETHLHCELSSVPVDEAFFGPAPGAGAPGPRGIDSLDAWIEPDGHGWWAPSSGFVEGEPRRVWTARDVDGAVVSRAEGRYFEAPAGAAFVEVLVGGRVRRQAPVTDR